MNVKIYLVVLIVVVYFFIIIFKLLKKRIMALVYVSLVVPALARYAITESLTYGMLHVLPKQARL